MLRDILTNLRAGEAPVLSTRENQFGERIAEEILSFEDGRWCLQNINCQSSQDLGLGTCRCQSHDPRHSERVSRKEALAAVRRYIAEQQRLAKASLEEIAWLDQAILEAPNLYFRTR
jgi:hypothetical protein